MTTLTKTRDAIQTQNGVHYKDYYHLDICNSNKIVTIFEENKDCGVFITLVFLDKTQITLPKEIIENILITFRSRLIQPFIKPKPKPKPIDINSIIILPWI